MNITEFAAYAGVSKAAVSRFFNGGYLSAEKKAAIAKAVEETGDRLLQNPVAELATLRGAAHDLPDGETVSAAPCFDLLAAPMGV